jgi:DNA-binding transcriptional MocR family regulator
MHKILAPGLRLSWMSAGRWQDRVRMLKYAQSRPNELLGQAMVAGFLATGQIPRHLRELRRRLAPQRLQMAEALAAELPEGTRLTLPAGGLALWVELPPGLSSLRLFDAALREGLRLSPGAMFSNDERFDGFLRINCGQPMEPAQRDAVRTLGRWLPAAAGRGRRLQPARRQRAATPTLPRPASSSATLAGSGTALTAL